MSKHRFQLGSPKTKVVKSGPPIKARGKIFIEEMEKREKKRASRTEPGIRLQLEGR